MEPSRFDELTKVLATSTSRRQALKTIAATTIGGILGLGGIGTAFGKNKTCAQFCASVFGAHTPAAEQCTSDAAHGKGLCSSCGSNASASSVCCTRNASGFCSSYSGATCCSGSQICSNGQCVAPTTTTTTTPAPPLCSSGGDPCNFSVTCGSQGGFTCVCATDVDGSVVCAAVARNGFCASCTSDAECGAGFVCLQEHSCACPANLCLPRC